MESAAIIEAARLIESARLQQPIARLPAFCRPETDQDGYAVQDARSDRETELGGWKVAPGPIPACGPIATSSFWRSTGRLAAAFQRPLQLEIELGLELGSDLTGLGRPVASRDVERAIAGARICIELLCSSYVDRSAVSRAEALADLQGNVGVVVGEPMVDWLSLDFTNLPIEASVDGKVIAAVTNGSARDAVLEAIAFLANHAEARGRELRAGHIIITGARIKPFCIHPGSSAVARMPGLAEATVELSA